MRLKIRDIHLTCKVLNRCLSVRERVEVVEWNKRIVSVCEENPDRKKIMIIHLIIRDWKFTTVIAITRHSTVNDNITKTSQEIGEIGHWNWCHITKRIHETSYSKGYRFLAISQYKIPNYVQTLKTLNVIPDSDSGLLFSLISLHHITWDLICYHLHRIMN